MGGHDDDFGDDALRRLFFEFMDAARASGGFDWLNSKEFAPRVPVESIREPEILSEVQRAEKRIAELEAELKAARDATALNREIAKREQKIASLLARTERLKRDNFQLRSEVAQLKSREAVRRAQEAAQPQVGDIDVTDLIKLCHPDRHKHPKLQEIAHRVTGKLLKMRRK